MKKRLICALFIFLASCLQLSANSLILNPWSTEFFNLKDEFDFSKKGNIYEKTFIMPLDLWRYPNITISVFFETRDDLAHIERVKKDEDFTTLAIQNAKDFLDRLIYIWLPYDSVHVCGFRCTLKPEQKKNIIKLLEAYHPNQHFKFKLSFIPLGNPKAKQEKIIEFPLYFVSNKHNLPTATSSRLNLMYAKEVKTWRKYYVKIEVLEDANLSKEFVPIVFIRSSSAK